jgi:glucose-6-phosphate-specific signal transduction histidine kinase
MTTRSDALLLWSPRILGVLVCLFLSLFGLDAFGGGRTFVEALPDFLIHIAPMLVLLGVVAVSWRWEWVGGVVFTGLAAAYAFIARRHLAWIPTISGPLLVVGALFLWSWAHRRRLRAAR